MRIRFGLLGPLLAGGDGVACQVGAGKQRVILAALLLNAGRTVPVDRLCELVWEEGPVPANAPRALHTHVTRLRAALADPLRDRIGTRPAGYSIEVRPGELDVDRFTAARDEGRAAIDHGDWETAAGSLRVALDQWRGTPLSDVPSPSLRGAETGRLRELRIQAMEWRFDADIYRGAASEAIADLPEAIAANRFHERFHEQLLLAYAATGRRADALATYQRAERVFVTELGIEPGDRLRELRDQAKARTRVDPAPLGATRPNGAEPTVPHQLPTGDAVVGRRAEIARLDALLSAGTAGAADAGGTTVAAITGRSGIGKTTLALHVARAWRSDHPDGQLHADMAGSTDRPADPGTVLAGFLRALGRRPEDIPETLDERAAAYRDLLSGRRILVVLDDVSDEGQVRPLLPGDGDSSVLLTARRRLAGLPGAHPLDMPELAPADGRRMLGELLGERRVQQSWPAAERLIELCAGLPLALRIAAARLAANPEMRIDELTERLADSRRRLDLLSHHDLAVRAGFEVSDRAMPRPAATLLRRLGILDTPTLPAWVAAAALDADERTVDEALEALVDARLLDPCEDGDTPHYRFHTLTRIYAEERAEHDEPADTRNAVLDRVLRGWLALTDVAENAHYGMRMALMPRIVARRDPGGGMARRVTNDPVGWVERERTNLVAAVEQAADHGLIGIASELAEQCSHMFEVGLRFDDIDRIMAAALHAAEQAGDEATTCRVLIESNFVNADRAAPAEVRRIADRILRYGVRHDDLRAQGAAHRQLGKLSQAAGYYDAALAHATAAVRAHHLAGDAAEEAHALVGAGHVYLERGMPDEAAAVLSDALATARAVDCTQLASQAAYWLGEVRLQLGRPREAEDLLVEAETLAASIGDQTGLAHCRLGHSRLHATLGRLDRADDLLAATLAQTDTLDNPMLRARILATRAQVRLDAGKPDEARAYLTRAREVAEASGVHVPMIDALHDRIMTVPERLV